MKIIVTLLTLAIFLLAKPLAIVNNQEINIQDVKNFLKASNIDTPYEKLQEKEKNLYLHQTIEKTLLIQEATKNKLDQNKEFKDTLKTFKDSLMVEMFMKSVFDKIKIEKSDIENYYNNHLYEFQQDKKLKARHIVVDDLKLAMDIIKQLDASSNKEESFIELAQKYSLDGSRENGGNLDWFTKNSVIEEFWNATNNLRPNEYTKNPVKSVFGYHIIFLNEIQEPLTVKFEQVYSNIENQLKMEKFQSIIDEKIKSIKKGAQIIIE